MRVARNERTDQQWVGLVVVGALILTGVVLLQGVVGASGAAGSRIGVSIEEVGTSEASGAANEGAYVKDVGEGTAAADAGFEAGPLMG